MQKVKKNINGVIKDYWYIKGRYFKIHTGEVKLNEEQKKRVKDRFGEQNAIKKSKDFINTVNKIGAEPISSAPDLFTFNEG